MEEKTFEELCTEHEEITAKIEGLGEEDQDNEEQRIQDEIRELEKRHQEQIKELKKRHLDLCQRKKDKEAETRELFSKLDTLQPLLDERRRAMMLKFQEVEDQRRRLENQRKRKMDRNGDGDRDAATLEDLLKENQEDEEPANLVGQHTYILHT